MDRSSPSLESRQPVPWVGMLLALLMAFAVQWVLVSLDSVGRTFGASADALAGEDGPGLAPEPSPLARLPEHVVALAWTQLLASLVCAGAVGVFAGQPAARRRVERAWLGVAVAGVGLGLVQGMAGASLAMVGAFVSAGGALLSRWCSLPEAPG